MDIYIYLILGLVLVLALYFLKSKKSSPIIVTDIICYPIKGCGPIHLKEGNIGKNGFLDDRRWFLANDKFEKITQRENPKILKIQPKLIYNNEGKLTNMILSCEGISDFDLKIKELTSEIVSVEVWKHYLPGQDEGEEVSNWIADALMTDAKYHLMRVACEWPVNQREEYEGVVSDDFKTLASDAAQFLVISEETYAETVSKLPEYKKSDIDISVFRGSIVARGVPRPFDEDWWENFKINDVNFQGIGRCPRCRVTMVSPKTLEIDSRGEPVSTLRKINGNGVKGYFGMHCVRLNDGTVRLGDEIQVVSRRKFPDI